MPTKTSAAVDGGFWPPAQLGVRDRTFLVRRSACRRGPWPGSCAATRWPICVTVTR